MVHDLWVIENGTKIGSKKQKIQFCAIFYIWFQQNGLTIITLFFDARCFSSWWTPIKNERNCGKWWLGGKKWPKKLTFCKILTSVTSDFFAFLDVPMEAKLFVPYECAIKNYKKLAAGMKKQHCAKTAFPQPT